MKSISAILPGISRAFGTQLRPYMHEPTSDLFKKYMVYKFFTPEGLIKNSERLLNTMYTFIGKSLADRLVMGTWGKVFVGGRNEHEVELEIELLRKSGLNPIIECPMDLLEGKLHNDIIKTNYFKCLNSVNILSHPNDAISLKLSNLIQPACLKLINEKQAKIYELVNYLNDKVGTNEMSYDELYEALHEYDADIYDKDTVEKIFNQVRAQFGNRTKIAVAHIYTYSHAASIDQKATNFFTNQFDFPSSIRNDFYRSIDQIFHLIEAVDKKHCTVYIDAETNDLQYAIDSITRQIQYKFNQPDKLIVKNTLQTYKTNITKEITLHIASCKVSNKPFGARLVKGAYVQTEKTRSANAHTVSPVCGNFRYTQQNMNDSLSLILKTFPPNSHLNVSTSNIDCVNLCSELVKLNKIPKSMVSFCQFRGMGDNISNMTVQNGFVSYKQIPYGPIDQVLASMVRRTEETPESIKASSADQIKVIKKELFSQRKMHIKGGIVGGFLIAILIGIL